MLDTGAVQVTPGDGHTCALIADGTVKCWGDNQSSEYGNDSTDPSETPVTVPSLKDVVQVAAGSDHTCALLGSGRVSCWGRNDRGQCGVEPDAVRRRRTMVQDECPVPLPH